MEQPGRLKIDILSEETKPVITQKYGFERHDFINFISILADSKYLLVFSTCWKIFSGYQQKWCNIHKFNLKILNQNLMRVLEGGEEKSF